MSSTIYRYLLAIACLAPGAVAVRPVAAQHHGGGHGSAHGGHGSVHGGGHGSVHGGHGSVHHGGYHSGWGHVVPSHRHHSGLYYSYGGANYYTPVAPPVRVQVLRPQVAIQPGFSPESAPPSEEIAPQSVKLEFGGFQQVEDLSGRLKAEANRWCLDMNYNYRNNPDFAATYREAYKILLAAKYVHSAEHRRDREAIRGELTAVEPLFHHVQEKVKTWTREERRPVGETGINGKAEIVESILHHLLYDVGVEPQHGAAADEAAPPPTEEALPPPAQ